MRYRMPKSENGQTLLLFMLGMICMLGFVALALDGGMILFDRRSAQNAADQAALAGGYQLARNPWDTDTLTSRIQNAANSRAHDNHYGTADGKTVVVNYPPSSGSINLVAGDTNLSHYVQVTITSSVNTSFLHFVYNGPVSNTVQAVAHVIPPPRESPFKGSGLVSLAPTGCGVMYLSGNLTANLVGGGIFVNSNDPNCALDGPGSASLVYTPNLTVVGGVSDKFNSSNLIVDPGPADSPNPDAALTFPPGYSMPPVPSCGSVNASKIGTEDRVVDGVTITYDKYSPGKMNGFPNGNVYFTPGIYCVSINGGGTNINNNQHFYNDPDDSQRILIVLTGANPCNMTVNGGATLELKGYGTDATYGSLYQGLLMYVNPGTNFTPVNAGPLIFNGTSQSYIKGTVYAPTCAVKMNGTGGNFYQGQMIGYNVTLLGGAEINLQYVPDENVKVQMPAKEDLTQ